MIIIELFHTLHPAEHLTQRTEDDLIRKQYSVGTYLGTEGWLRLLTATSE